MYFFITLEPYHEIMVLKLSVSVYPYTENIFVRKLCMLLTSAFTSVAYIYISAYRTKFIIEANTMNHY